jgi:hypothetical protein
MNNEEWRGILEKATSELCKSLDRFGCDEILKLLIEHSGQDVVAMELLARYPTITAIGTFIASLPTLKPKQKRRRKGKKGITS